MTEPSCSHAAADNKITTMKIFVFLIDNYASCKNVTTLPET